MLASASSGRNFSALDALLEPLQEWLTKKDFVPETVLEEGFSARLGL